MSSEIRYFTGKYRFLSNFYPSLLTINGVNFPTVEHFFQAMKATSYEDYIAIASAATPGEAKRLGRIIRRREDWENVKNSVMEYALTLKFSNPSLQDQLLQTGAQQLIEGNTWKDTYWGVDDKLGGQNHLGLLLMKIRQYFQSFKQANENRQIQYDYSTTCSS